MINGKAVEGKQYPLYYEYNWYSIPMRKQTTYSVKASDWNADGDNGRGELRSSFGRDYRQINIQLHNQLDSYDRMIADYYASHNQITNDLIRSILDGKPISRQDEGRDAVEYIKQHLASELKRGKIGQSVYENGMSAMRIFQVFLKVKGLGTYKDNSILLGEITPELLDKYIEYRKDILGNTDATVNHSLTPVLKACNEACAMGLINAKVNSHIQGKRIIIKGPGSLNEDKNSFDGKYLTKEQIKELVSYCNNCTEQRRRDYLEIFLFAFHAAGLRIIDVMTLQWACIDFDNEQIIKTQVKTKKRNIVPLTKPAIEILKRWKDKGNSKYVFGLLPETFDCDDIEALYHRRNTVTKNVDQSLRVAGDDLGVRLRFHTARHSFAMNALNDGMPMEEVSQLLGHSSSAITEKTYARFVPERLATGMKKLNYDFLPDPIS